MYCIYRMGYKYIKNGKERYGCNRKAIDGVLHWKWFLKSASYSSEISHTFLMKENCHKCRDPRMEGTAAAVMVVALVILTLTLDSWGRSGYPWLKWDFGRCWQVPLTEPGRWGSLITPQASGSHYGLVWASPSPWFIHAPLHVLQKGEEEYKERVIDGKDRVAMGSTCILAWKVS